MIHPACGLPARALETREAFDRVKRRYECKQCNVRFTTYEAVESEGKTNYREQVGVAIKLLQSALRETLT